MVVQLYQQEAGKALGKALVLNSQLVKTVPAQEEVGDYARKKVMGRKRHLLIDT